MCHCCMDRIGIQLTKDELDKLFSPETIEFEYCCKHYEEKHELFDDNKFQLCPYCTTQLWKHDKSKRNIPDDYVLTRENALLFRGTINYEAITKLKILLDKIDIPLNLTTFEYCNHITYK